MSNELKKSVSSSSSGASFAGNDDDRHSSSTTSTSADLKELCHLLNEERKKMFQLTEQMKSTSCRTIEKLEGQIGVYQKKLLELEQRQHQLIEENQTLKTQLERSKKKSKHEKKVPETPPTNAVRHPSIDDPLQQQISIQTMFDAIKTAEVYESLENYDQTEKIFLQQFCHLIWKYLDERSKPKSSCLL